MTNTTRAIAALSIVAGLGVATLPLNAHAAKVIDGPAPDTGAESGATYDDTLDGKVQTTTDLKLVISDVLSIETDNTEDAVELTSTDGTDYASTPLGVTVTTKNSTGYKLSIKASGSNTTKTSLMSGTDEIKAGTGTFDIAQAVAGQGAVLSNATNSEWGYRIDSLDAGNYIGITEADVTIANQGTPTTNSGVKTNVTFGAKIKDGQAAGTYTGQVTFTATNNAK